MVDNPKIAIKTDIRSVLFYIFRIDTESKIKVSEVAERMGECPDTIYDWINGTREIPANRIPRLHKALGREDIINYICNECGYHPVKINVNGPGEPTKSPHEYLCEIVEHLINAINDTKANDGNDYVRARREQGRYDKALGLIYELKERRKRAVGK